MVWEKKRIRKAENYPLGFALLSSPSDFPASKFDFLASMRPRQKKKKHPLSYHYQRIFLPSTISQPAFLDYLFHCLTKNRTSWFHEKLKTKTSLVYVISERQKNLVFPILVIFPPFPHFFDVHDFHARSFFTLEFFCHTFDKSLEYISVRYLLVFCHSQHGDSLVTDKNLHWQLFSDKKLS